jgi:hypothetical protein
MESWETDMHSAGSSDSSSQAVEWALFDLPLGIPERTAELPHAGQTLAPGLSHSLQSLKRNETPVLLERYSGRH